MQIEGISHITFIVRDLERTARFLCQGLGATQVYDSSARNFSLSPEKFFVLGGIWLVAMQGEPPTERTYRHLAFKVAEDALPAFEARLLSIGVDVKPPRPRVEGEGDSLYFYDFDNHLFELHTGTLDHRLKRYATGAEGPRPAVRIARPAESSMATPHAPARHPDDVTIVAATFDDIGVITQLTRAAYAKWVPLTGREPLPMKVDYAAAFQAHRFDLLVDARQVLGLIETVQQNRHLLIVNIAIQPESQGRGFGRRLMAHVEALASESGLEGMRLYTNSRFAENIGLYASLGYVIEREEAMNGGTAVHMVKKLEGL